MVKELLASHKKMLNEGNVIDIKRKDVKGSLEGDTFEFLYTQENAVFRDKGGYMVVCPASDTALFNFILEVCNLDKNGSQLEGLSDEEKELLKGDIDITTWLLNVPFFAIGDIDLKYKIVEMCIESMRKKIDEIEKSEPQEETTEEDEAFRHLALVVSEDKE